MLKIKDDVDLKKLKNIGFKEERNKNNELIYYSFDLFSTMGEFIQIWVFVYDRKIYLSCGTKDIVIDYLDILYNFIRAGLVEKVVEV